MKTMNANEQIPKGGELLLSNGKSRTISFLNKKRFNSDNSYNELKIIIQEGDGNSFLIQKITNISQNFLDNFSEIINNSKYSFNKYFHKEKKRYFGSNFNLKLINSIINYFTKEESSLRNANILNSEELINLVKTFFINDFEFSILTLLINKTIFYFSNRIEKETIYYLGLYTKYILSNAYSEVFNLMLKSDIHFKNWYLQYKSFLETIDLSLIKVNKGKTPNQNLEMVDFNLMINDLFESKKEKEKEKEKKDVNKINTIETIKKINMFNLNRGKKINVVVVYQEESSQDNTNDVDNGYSSHNENEGLQTDISA